MSGGWYVSLSTTFHPGGEMRGQIVVPSDFLPGASPAPRPVQQEPRPDSPPPSTAVPGSIQPPNTGDAGLR
jgi:hypothetical protein